VAVVYEVTDQVNEQKETEVIAENLRSAILSRDNFLGVASHELNTPLTSLKLQLQMNKRILNQKGQAAFPPAALHKLLDATLFQTERLGRLVNDMLDVSRVSSGKLTIEMSMNNLSSLVQEAVECFAPQLEAAGCELEMDILPDIYLPLDPSRIEQVVINFITNIIKYAPGKPVHVWVIRTPEGARVSVRDEGDGVPKEHQDRIFGRFERATPSNKVSGLGLGLYICKHIVDEHRGKIFVESQPGKGATFSFELRA
jgi:signal transduction histidine kinase